jgi:hypothetical protein
VSEKAGKRDNKKRKTDVFRLDLLFGVAEGRIRDECSGEVGRREDRRAYENQKQPVSNPILRV